VLLLQQAHICGNMCCSILLHAFHPAFSALRPEAASLCACIIAAVLLSVFADFRL
jgi:hypothetical protein